MAKVFNELGQEVDFEAAAHIMDDEIREEMHSSYEPGFDSQQAFFDEYARRHEAKFGNNFAPYTGEAW